VRSNNSCYFGSKYCVHHQAPQHQWKVCQDHLKKVWLMSMITGFIFNSLNYMKTVDITKSSIVKDVCSSKRNVKLSICKKTQVTIQFISKLLTSIALIYILSAFPQNKLLFLVKTLHRRSSNRSQPYHVVSTQTCFIGRLKQNTPVY